MSAENIQKWPADDPSREMEVIEPAVDTIIMSGGAEINIEPMKVGQIPRFLKAIRGVISALPLDQITEEGDITISPELFIDHGEELIGAAAVAAKLDPETIEDMDLDDFAELVRKIIVVNADFFVKRVAPALGKMAREAGEVAAGIGPTPSKR